MEIIERLLFALIVIVLVLPWLNPEIEEQQKSTQKNRSQTTIKPMSSKKETEVKPNKNKRKTEQKPT